MGRRHLTVNEIESTLRRGKSVEGFVGVCDRDGKAGFRHVSLSSSSDKIHVRIFETVDRDIDDSDVTEWGPLNASLTLGEADREFLFPTLSACFAYLESAWPGISCRLVNDGVLQDEYLDFRKAKRGNV